MKKIKPQYVILTGDMHLSRRMSAKSFAKAMEKFKKFADAGIRIKWKC